MSLNWNLTGIKDYETRCWTTAGKDHWSGAQEGERVLELVTHGLIMMTMQIGMGEITEETAEEFFTRASMVEKLFGASRRGPAPDHAPVYYTAQDVRDHIGLTTNVFPTEPFDKWSKRITGIWQREQAQAWKRTNAQAGKGA